MRPFRFSVSLAALSPIEYLGMGTPLVRCVYARVHVARAIAYCEKYTKPNTSLFRDTSFVREVFHIGM